MSNARNLSNLLSSTGDVKTSRLSNVPPADLINDTSPQLGGDLDLNSHVITGLSTDLVNDTTPQLGGDLDLNGHVITSLSTDLVDDTTPQLGGDLDLNGHVITGLSTDLVSDTSPQLGGTLDCNGFAIDLGNWTITETSGVLYFATSGTNKMKLDASGNLTVVGDVTASGTI
jgi:hypothetical protein